MKVLAIIPARAGSTRIPDKNTRPFCGSSLIEIAIAQAKCHPLIDRIIVDTDSEKTAALARACGAETPFLRPARLATKDADINDAISLLLRRLKEKEKYEPDYFFLLQTTSPLREGKDITACFDLMQQGGATTVLTVIESNPRFFYIDDNSNLILVNRPKKGGFAPNTQDWQKGYVLNGGAVYLVQTRAFLSEGTVYTKKIKAIVCEKWRGIDVDDPEDFVVAELLYREKKKLRHGFQRFIGSKHA